MPRPKGSRNVATLLKEENMARIMKRANGYLLSEVEGVLKAVIKKAKEGDMAAAKMILDRVIPAKRSVDELPKQNFAIQVNITPTEITPTEVKHAEDERKDDPISGERIGRSAGELDVDPAGGRGEGRQGFEIVTLDGNAKRE